MRKQEKEICKFNSIKYYVISLVLDILVRQMVVSIIKNTKNSSSSIKNENIFFDEKNNVEISFNDLMKEIWKNSTFDMEWSISVARVELIIVEMSWMGLIIKTGETNNNLNIKLTQDGFIAYKDQRFHSIAASLLEAKESRKLALIAVIVSFITFVATIISFLYN